MAWNDPERCPNAGIVMREMNVVTVVGARPQFVKAAAVSRAVAAFNAAVAEFEKAGAALDEGRAKDLYGDGDAAERVVSPLAAGEG